MTVKSMMEIEFPVKSYEEWQAAAEGAIGGKSLEEHLITKTIEGVTLQPLYTKKTLEKLGEHVFVQGEAVKSSKRRPGWLVAQEVLAESAADFLAKARDDLSRGNEMIVYTSSHEFKWTDEELKKLAALITENPFYFKLTGDDRDILRVFDFIPTEGLESLQGVICSEEPVQAPKKVRSKMVDTIPVHNAGGTAVHELGVALSIMAETVQKGGFKETADDLWIRFAIDTQFFQEIAKLRAFRVLWKAFSEAYGEKADSIPVFTETSIRSYSKLDPYVNLLRAGNATFSAVLGGTDAHTVHPHDFLTVPDAQSRRIARNVQLIIKEESHVSHVTDASGGSYFIEQLTKEYVGAAWKYFLEIEEAGGYEEVIRSGWLTDDIQAKWLERKKAAATREISLIGTNIYANPHEAVKDQAIDTGHMEYMTAKRLAVPFEKLRHRSRETELKTAILHLGPLKEVKRKSDFVQGVLAVGGIEPLISGELTDAQSLSRFLSENSIDYAVLCGSEETVENLLPDINTETVLDFAGKMSDAQLESWKALGIHDSIFAGQDIVAKLGQILDLGKAAL